MKQPSPRTLIGHDPESVRPPTPGDSILSPPLCLGGYEVNIGEVQVEPSVPVSPVQRLEGVGEGEVLTVSCMG